MPSWLCHCGRPEPCAHHTRADTRPVRPSLNTGRWKHVREHVKQRDYDSM